MFSGTNDTNTFASLELQSCSTHMMRHSKICQLLNCSKCCRYILDPVCVRSHLYTHIQVWQKQATHFKKINMAANLTHVANRIHIVLLFLHSDLTGQIISVYQWIYFSYGFLDVLIKVLEHWPWLQLSRIQGLCVPEEVSPIKHQKICLTC